MPTVTVRYLGPIRRPCRQRRHEVEIREHTTAGELLDQLGYQPREKPLLSIHVNGQSAKADVHLSEGDEITFGILAGGG